jgi:hypothetical protein
MSAVLGMSGLVLGMSDLAVHVMPDLAKSRQRLQVMRERRLWVLVLRLPVCVRLRGSMSLGVRLSVRRLAVRRRVGVRHCVGVCRLAVRRCVAVRRCAVRR